MSPSRSARLRRLLADLSSGSTRPKAVARVRRKAGARVAGWRGRSPPRAEGRRSPGAAPHRWASPDLVRRRLGPPRLGRRGKGPGPRPGHPAPRRRRRARPERTPPPRAGGLRRGPRCRPAPVRSRRAERCPCSPRSASTRPPGPWPSPSTGCRVEPTPAPPGTPCSCTAGASSCGPGSGCARSTTPSSWRPCRCRRSTPRSPRAPRSHARGQSGWSPTPPSSAPRTSSTSRAASSSWGSRPEALALVAELTGRTERRPRRAAGPRRRPPRASGCPTREVAGPGGRCPHRHHRLPVARPRPHLGQPRRLRPDAGPARQPRPPRRRDVHRRATASGTLATELQGRVQPALPASRASTGAVHLIPVDRDVSTLEQRPARHVAGRVRLAHAPAVRPAVRLPLPPATSGRCSCRSTSTGSTCSTTRHSPTCASTARSAAATGPRCTCCSARASTRSSPAASPPPSTRCSPSAARSSAGAAARSASSTCRPSAAGRGRGGTCASTPTSPTSTAAWHWPRASGPPTPAGGVPARPRPRASPAGSTPTCR